MPYRFEFVFLTLELSLILINQTSISPSLDATRTTISEVAKDRKWEVMMSLIPRDSWSDFYRVFDHAFPSIRTRFDAEAFSPRVDVIEKETAFEIIADLPGVAKDDVIITYKNGALTIEASTSKTEENTDQNKVIHKERYEGKMVRSFSLSENVNPKDIYAEFEDGVLVVVVPKLETQQVEDHRITIS
jgi:HSP20 family protein